MELVLRGLHWSICLIYLDNIIVYSANFPQHLKHLRDIFQRFRTAGLKLKPSKCHLACSSVTFLGHCVSSAGVEPDPSNIDKVKTWPIPTSATHVRAFLGLCSYFRRFIRHFARTAEPLYHLTHNGVSFSWSAAANEAFSVLKQELTSQPIMAFPNFSISIHPLHWCFPSFTGLCSFTTSGRKRACHCICQPCAICFGKKMVYLWSGIVCHCVVGPSFLALSCLSSIHHHYWS